MSELFTESSEMGDDAAIEVEPQKGRKFIFTVIISILLLLILSGAGIAYYFYQTICGANLLEIKESVLIQVPSGSNLDKITEILSEKGILKDKKGFLWVCSIMKFYGKSGQYRITKNTNSYHSLVGVLRGEQESVNLTFNNFRLKEQLAGHVSRFIEADSLSIIAAMIATDFLDQKGFNSENALSMYIPNSYKIYWDSDADVFVKRMEVEYQKFWNENRLEKAKKQNLSPIEVYILASIVDAETTFNPEKPRVAGVYLNRLRTKGWKLEADPTVVFAGGDFSVRRVTNDMLQINSPYNTYKNVGLPPGPIRMASVSAIDAVLDAEEHDYWFFCAKPPSEGQPAQHAFAKTMAQHGANARVYRQWLNLQRIYK